MKKEIEIIEAEIKWCKEDKSKTNLSPDLKRGFIQGLEQAVLLIKKLGKENL